MFQLPSGQLDSLCKDFATVLDVQPGRDASSSHRFSGVKVYDIQTAGEAGEALGKLSGYKEVPRSQAQKTASRGLVWKSDGRWIYVDILYSNYVLGMQCCNLWNILEQ